MYIDVTCISDFHLLTYARIDTMFWNVTEDTVNNEPMYRLTRTCERWSPQDTVISTELVYTPFLFDSSDTLLPSTTSGIGYYKLSGGLKKEMPYQAMYQGELVFIQHKTFTDCKGIESGQTKFLGVLKPLGSGEFLLGWIKISRIGDNRLEVHRSALFEVSP